MLRGSLEKDCSV